MQVGNAVYSYFYNAAANENAEEEEWKSETKMNESLLKKKYLKFYENIF